MQSDDENPASPPQPPLSEPTAKVYPLQRPSKSTSPSPNSDRSQPQGKARPTPISEDDIWRRSDEILGQKAMTLPEFGEKLAKELKAERARYRMEKNAKAVQAKAEPAPKDREG